MSLSRLAAKCRACPDVDICDHKQMEAYGFLPLPSMSEPGGELVRTSTELDISIDALTKEIARAGAERRGVEMAGAFYGRQLNHPKEKPEKRPVSESYLIGVDISDNGDTSLLTVSRLEGSKVTVVNFFMGEEAEWMYERLTNQKVGVLKWTPQNELGGEKNA